ncbi:hypothetical protein LZ757_01545 [Xylella fastidiosa subsp. morus]|jgi:hypothetical protein|uniref:Lipoprotein n=4 Tax=Xylella fastidiosa TaxID=2371 RepID=Q87AN7_XYLFT|nr:hypothetical protein [Xylella fastidiosa]ADN62654.1 hypothetical protein XFLM_03325 [Xylella fastidiosa subsp. fastidiosa GB514]KAF0570609.1 hypothetical protein P305_09300 [Xylella fastidiosa subsp. fastidiosa Mus-1]AAO29620.1 conserved hypothetical protein [Xylella fastidiosa Temecula1]ACB93289.1 conserved hypothetical protein [Xylella fastidiosa M23]AIC09879.1 hypothetical protein D934_05660 [Xylella fastidiosa subsp. sandyi Ann-1]
MKNTYVIALLAVTTATLLSGCATKRYGRLQPLTSYESRNYNCTQIDLELAKIDAFEQQVAEQAKFSGMSVASFLGDFGIGNTLERNQAIKTAKERRTQLMTARSTKDCDNHPQPKQP